MASPTFSTRAIVLRKTKLGESDLIITLLAGDGSQMRAVAKGARKPTSTFSSRLELYSIVDVLCSQGKSLDIIKEARLVTAHENLRFALVQSTCAAALAELLDKMSQMGLEHERMFALAEMSFGYMNDCNEQNAVAICAAALLKALALAGFRPNMSSCVMCGSDLNDSLDTDDTVYLSTLEGGVVCPSCYLQTNCRSVERHLIRWVDLLIRTPFADIAKLGMEMDAALHAMTFSHRWIQDHVGVRSKSIDFLLTSGILGLE